VNADLQPLVDEACRALAPLEARIRSHPFLAELEAGAVSEEQLRAFVGEQYRVLRSDRRSFAQLAARYPDDPSGAFFVAMAAGEGEALARLIRFAAALGAGEDDLHAYEPHPGCQAYPAFVAWLALNGSRLDVALAFLVNLDAWGANCARMGTALADRYGLEADELAFFAYFATPSPGVREQIAEVAGDGLAAGDSPSEARRAARLLQAYELLFWDSLIQPERWTS
jgi:TENA/THI-4/PQQC family